MPTPPKRLADFPRDVLESLLAVLTPRLAIGSFVDDASSLATERGRLDIARRLGRQSALDDITTALNLGAKQSNDPSKPTTSPSLD